MTLAIFGIESGPLNTIVQLVTLAVVVVWLALVWYTLADARRRLDDQMLIGSAVLAALIFPFLGTIVYMIVRPPEYLDDVRERELEMHAAEARLASLDYQLCPHCDAPAGRDFLRCPHCLRKLRDTCTGCQKPLDPDWMICPYCETEIPGVTPQRRSRRRGAEVVAGEPPAELEQDAPHDSGDLLEAAPAYEHVSQPPPSFEDIDRARAQYEAGQPTQTFSEIPGGEEPFGEASYEDPPWSDAPGTGPSTPPPAR